MAEIVVRETTELTLSSVVNYQSSFEIVVHNFVLKDNFKCNDVQDTCPP